MANTISATPGVELSPSGQLAGPANYKSIYDYSHQYDPDTFLDLYPQYGSGKITAFSETMGMTKPFMSDIVIWGEQGRLHNFVEGATVTTDSFDCGATKHNLRVGDIIWASDGTKQLAGDVYEITDDFIFKAHNRSAVGAFGFSTTVNLFAASNEFVKGAGNFTQTNQYDPEIKENYPQIVKGYYETNKSDMAHATWLSAEGHDDAWFLYEAERERQVLENKKELTNVFGPRAVAGSNSATAGKAGMNGVVPQVEAGGNIGNGNIDTIDDINDWTKRLRKQGKCRSFMWWVDQLQYIDADTMLSDQNSYWDGGSNWGMFDNDKDMGLHMGFKDFSKNGFDFYLSRFDALDDPTLFGGEKFLATGVGSIMCPAAQKYITEEGESTASPYLVIRNRVSKHTDRTLEEKVLGTPLNPIREDRLEIHWTTEFTNQLVGANEWAVNYR